MCDLKLAVFNACPPMHGLCLYIREEHAFGERPARICLRHDEP